MAFSLLIMLIFSNGAGEEYAVGLMLGLPPFIIALLVFILCLTALGDRKRRARGAPTRLGKVCKIMGGGILLLTLAFTSFVLIDMRNNYDDLPLVLKFCAVPFVGGLILWMFGGSIARQDTARRA